MKLYCLVQDGVVVEGPKSLPKCWRNVSCFDCLSKEELLKYGWYEVVDSGPEIPEGSQKAYTGVLEIMDSYVVRYYEVYTPEELPDTITNKEKLAATDRGFIRVSDDLIDVLLRRGVVSKADFNAAALKKIEDRKALREGL